MPLGVDPAQSFEVRQDDLAKVQWREPRGDDGLAKGEADVAIRRFALTANNITYARLRSRIPGLGFGYWEFFPAGSGWGSVPVWGLADVVASRHPNLTEGTTLFGFFPMATYLRMTVGAVSGATVLEESLHRRSLPATYNQYLIANRGLALGPEAMDAYMVLRPSFSLSFCCATYLSEQRWFGCRRILISSASSKAALGLAMLLAGEGLEVVGLTSRQRVAQVAARAVHDRVLPYEEITALASDEPTVFVDIANATDVTRAVHDHWDRDCEPASPPASRTGPTSAKPSRARVARCSWRRPTCNASRTCGARTATGSASPRRGNTSTR